MKQLILSTFITVLAFSAFAQDDKNEEYELRGNEQYGYIINKKGKKVEGIVRLVGTEETPWENQKKVKFISKSDIDPEKKRQRLKTLKTSDLKEYVAFDGDKERHFRLVKWANTREGLMSEGEGAGGTFKQIKNLSSTRHMAEVMVDGEISVFRIYGYPATFAVGQGDVDRAKRETEELLSNPSVLVQKGEKGKVKTFKASDIKELVKDCKTVKNKLAEGKYSSYDPAKQEKKRSGMGKLIKNEVDRAGMGTRLLIMAEEVFSDYNATCK